jgi:hypothetical protein
MPYVAYILSEAKPGNLFLNLGIETAETQDAIAGFARDILGHLNLK